MIGSCRSRGRDGEGRLHLSGKADKTLCGKRVFVGIKEAELCKTREFLRAQGG